MNRKNVSLISMVAGVVFILVSLLADVIGIGTHAGFNNIQLSGVLLGLAFVIIGYILWRLKDKAKKPSAK